MRRCVSLLLVLLALFGTLSGCSEEKTQTEAVYTVYESGGKWYMKTGESTASVGAVVTAGVQDINELPLGWPLYASVPEMRDAIMSGELEPWLVQWLRETAPAGEPIPLCDMDALYEAVLPERLTCTGVLFAGDRMEFPFTGRNISGRAYIFYDRTEYQHYSRQCVWAGAPRLTLTAEVRHETARVLLCEMSERERLTALYGWEVCYELDTGDGVMFVYEPFQAGNSKELRTIEMLGRKGEVYYRIVMQFRGEVPTVRWLSQFGIKPLEGAY